MSELFTNSPGDRGSIPGRVIPKMAHVASLPNTQYYKE